MNRPLIFSGLSDEQQRDLVAAAQPRQLKPRDVLGQQGEPAELFALVQIGHMKLAQVNAAGAESLVRFIGPGDCYGAIALVPGRPYPLSAIAVEPTRVLAWPRAVITGFAERLPRLKSNVFEEITRRMAGVLSTAQELATGRVPQRLANALLRLAEHGGDRTPHGVHIVHPVRSASAAALTEHPLVAKVGERVRLYCQNVGPNDQASTHVIGAIFDRVWFEGNPKNEMRGMQTALIGSSNGAVLEFIVPEEGRYVLVDHEFADASKGAVGQILGLSKAGTMTSITPPMQH